MPPSTPLAAAAQSLNAQNVAAVRRTVNLNTTDGGITIATAAMDARLSVEAAAANYALAINNLLETRTLTPEPHATFHGLFLGPLHITFGTLSPRVSRRTQVLCARDRFDGIALQLVRAGTWHGELAGRSVGGGPGTMMLFDFAQTFSVIDDGDRSFVVVIIPRALAIKLAADPATLHGRAVDAAAGAVLAGFIGGLVAHPEALRAEQGPALADTLIELAALAFREADDLSAEDKRGAERRMLDRVDQLIAMRLNASDLTPEWLARKMGVSRSELYAAFHGTGGVARLVWERRLTAAHALLSDPLEDRTIASIAHLFAFASDAHFSRAFKQRYGLTPTAARKAARA